MVAVEETEHTAAAAENIFDEAEALRIVFAVFIRILRFERSGNIDDIIHRFRLRQPEIV
ncbi:hypothetical protein D3C73_1662130 [compost metagenome]